MDPNLRLLGLFVEFKTSFLLEYSSIEAVKYQKMASN